MVENATKAAAATPVAFQTKPQLAQAMLKRANDAIAPFGCVRNDCIYGADTAQWLEQTRVPYASAMRNDTDRAVLQPAHVRQRCVQTLIAAARPDDWPRLTAGDGATGPRWYDRICLPLAEAASAGWTLWLLLRRRLATPKQRRYYRVFAPVGTVLAAMVRVVGTRRAIEEYFETDQGGVGLNEYEVRHWDTWHRHSTLALFAHACLTGTPRPDGGDVLLLSVPEVRRLLTRLLWTRSASVCPRMVALTVPASTPGASLPLSPSGNDSAWPTSADYKAVSPGCLTAFRDGEVKPIRRYLPSWSYITGIEIGVCFSHSAIKQEQLCRISHSRLVGGRTDVLRWLVSMPG